MMIASPFGLHAQQQVGGQVRIPTHVLAIKCHELTEQALRAHLGQFQNFSDNYPVFIQASKQIAFVQFPSVEASQLAHDYINSGAISVPSGRQVTAQYSNRASVTMGNQRPDANTAGMMPLAGIKREHSTMMSGMLGGMGPLGQIGSFEAPMLANSPNNNEPSPVLCIKTDISEEDMHRFLNELHTSHGLPAPVEIMRLNSKNMCFVQYDNLLDAKLILEHFQTSQYHTETNTLMAATYSKRRRIERPANKTGTSAGGADTAGVTSGGGPTKPEAEPSKVLIVSLRPNSGKTFALTADNFLVPFSKFGMVQKVVVFNNTADSEILRALIQYSMIEYANLAREKMDGATMGEFRLMVRYSERPELEVTRNSQKMRDFSNPWLEDNSPQNNATATMPTM